MTHKERIKEVYFVAGVLEGYSYLMNLPEGMAMSLSECAERLELIGAQLIKEDVENNEKPTEAFGRVYPSTMEAGTD